MKRTDSSKGEVFDPLKPSFHLDVDNIVSENIKFANNAIDLVNSTQKKLIQLSQHQINTTNQKTYDKIQEQINSETIKLIDYEEHLEFAENSLKHAQSLKIDLDQ